jgi:dTDP-4-amino-4,6-dideoxygalactose transaminase
MPTAPELDPALLAHERALATLTARFGRPHVALTCSGSAALEVALTALDLGPGDEVVLPAIGCHRIAASVLRVGAAPVFTPVGRRLVLTPDAVHRALGPATRAVIAVHQYGLRCPVDEIRAGLPSHVQMVEDAAQSSGLPPTAAEGPQGRHVVITSFGPTKPIPLGFGGAVFADDPAALRLVGTGTRDEAMEDRPALPVPFPEGLRPQLAAALSSSDRALHRRRHYFSHLGDVLDGAGFVPVFPPVEMPSWTHLPVWCRSAVLRDVLLDVADECGVPAQPAHHVPLAELPLFRARCRTIGPGPESSRLAIFRAPRDTDLVARFARMLPAALGAAS